jgi:hypothetical protein
MLYIFPGDISCIDTVIIDKLSNYLFSQLHRKYLKNCHCAQGVCVIACTCVGVTQDTHTKINVLEGLII